MSTLDTNFDSVLRPTQADSALGAMREIAKKDFLASSIPSRKDENWRYLNVRPIFESAYSNQVNAVPSTYVENSFYYKIIFIDGILDTDKSQLPKGLKLSKLSDAIKANLVNLTSFKNKNIFTDLNIATLSVGYYLECFEKIDEPVSIQHTYTTSSNYGSGMLFVKIKPDAKLSVVEDSSTNSHFVNHQLLIHLDKDANLDWTQLHQSSVSTKYQNTEINLLKNAQLNFTQINLGGGIVRQDVTANILESHANANIQGLYLLKDSQSVDNHLCVNHLVPNSTCRQNYKGILDNEARAIFDGKIFVAVGADGTVASQLNKNILLSNTAEVDTKPQLEIYADDVKCNHGATLGKFSEEEMFYFLSRGIDRNTAIQMLSAGFVRDVLLQVGSKDIQKYLLPRIEKTLKEYAF